MLTEFNTLDKLLSRRSGSSDPVSNNPSYSTRVCAKCALKIWNVVEPPCFLKANLNSVLADVEATSDDCETQQRWKRKSKSSTFGKTKTPTAEPESQASVLRTPTPACFYSAFKELAFDSLSFSETIASWWSGFAIAWLTLLFFVMLHAKLMPLYLLFWQLSVIGHILTNQVLRCWADGGFEKLKRVRRRFFLGSPSSPLGQTTLVTLLISRSQRLSARPSDP